MKRWLFGFLCLSCIFNSFAEIQIPIRDDVLANYAKFVKDRDVYGIRDFRSEFIRRDVVDMVIAQQALKLGGFDETFRYWPDRANFRNARLLQKGELLLSFDSYWLEDAKAMEADVYISSPVIRNGEYHAGIFASPEHPSIFSLKSLSDFQDYTGVSTPIWRTDWQTLSDLPLKSLVREDEWVSQANLVSRMLVDFMMMPFSSDGKDTYQLETIRLRSVPNVALLLKDSRHFVISRHHPLGKAAYDAIESGLKQLRSEKRIVSAYKYAGFLIDTSKYNVLNKSPTIEADNP